MHIHGITREGASCEHLGVQSSYTARADEAEAPVKAIARRLRRLEHQLRPTDGKPTLLLFACNAAQELALDDDTRKQILRETGCLSTGAVGVIDLTKIPDGLNAEETERYLRENAAEICAFRPAPTA